MLIIIDAYNYMKMVSGETHISQKLEKEFMNQFEKYVQARGNRLMVVFDAGPGLYKEHQQIGAIQIIYSGQMQSADDVIIEYLQAHVGEDILVVSSDREIREAAKNCNIVSVNSPDFHIIFKTVLELHKKHDYQITKQAVKTNNECNDTIDQLMEAGSRNIVSNFKKELPFFSRHVKNNKKTSKNDAWTMKKINKI
jgi:predicted RNA-binding protein with PIN domain